MDALIAGEPAGEKAEIVMLRALIFLLVMRGLTRASIKKRESIQWDGLPGQARQ
jgi:hypothetical protein